MTESGTKRELLWMYISSLIFIKPPGSSLSAPEWSGWRAGAFTVFDYDR
jgi:hypothetical protein